MEFHSKDLNGP
jgi:hypothetical protein